MSITFFTPTHSAIEILTLLAESISKGAFRYRRTFRITALRTNITAIQKEVTRKPRYT